MQSTGVLVSKLYTHERTHTMKVVIFLLCSYCLLGVFAIPTKPGVTDNCRCVFNVGTAADKKLAALQYVCGNFNCTSINPGGECFYPDTVEAHSAWAINQWFQAHRDTPTTSCNFGGIAMILCQDCNCTVSTVATTQQMTDAINYVCGNYDCSPIYPGGAFYIPDTIPYHCAWAVESWYLSHSWAPETCDFNSAAYLTPKICQGR
eukprot:TRINITY_DN6303_c0_g1_i1.p1 TRINITY_DN6303_c0_g1~~TRINITY_DN6303_c0_g1_i1.p1  ORF type:complete len:205 (+),score=39.30 TRINITY_DN6303_c0_g1_i1:15-629(+)